MSQLAVLIPLMRPHRIAPLVENIRETTEPCNIVVIATGECADAARDLQVTLLEDDGGTYPVRINRAFRETTERYLHLSADDLRYHAGWFEAAMRVMETLHGVVVTNDQLNGAGQHFLIDRGYVMECSPVGDSPGDVLCEAYPHAYVDDELRNMARMHGRFAYANDSIVEHLHVGNGKAPDDDVYRAGNASMSAGLNIHLSRKHLWGAQ